MEKSKRPTQEQIEKWKKEYGAVFHFDYEDGMEAYFRKPDRNQTKHIISKGGVNALNGVESLIANCWLAGDEEIKQDIGKYHPRLRAGIDDILEVKKAEVKKL